MKLKASWNFEDGTLEGLPGPTLTCTRADEASAADYYGMAQYYSANEARFAEGMPWDNWLTHSDDLSHADWTKTNVTVSQDGVLDPFGNEAWTVTDDATLGFHAVGQSDPAPFDMFLGHQVLLKAGTGRYVTMAPSVADLADVKGVTFDLQEGEVVDGNEYYEWGGNYGYLESITPLDDGWYLVNFVAHQTTNTPDFYIVMSDDGVTANVSYSGSGDTIYVSKPRAYNATMPPSYQAPLSAANLPGTGAVGGVVKIGKQLPRINYLANSRLNGFAGNGSPPYQFGYPGYGWNEDTATATATPIWVEDSEYPVPGFSSKQATGGPLASSAGVAPQPIGVRIDGVNQIYRLRCEPMYSWCNPSGLEEDATADWVFSIYIDEVDTVPSGPIVTFGSNFTASSYTLPANIQPGTRIEIPVQTTGPFLSYGVNSSIYIGLGADNVNDTGGFAWSRPQFEPGTKATPWMPTTGVTFNAGEHVLFDEFGENCRPGLLVDQPVTSLITYACDVSNAAWVKTNTSVASNTSGSYNRDGRWYTNRWRASGGNPVTSSVRQAVTLATDTEYTLEGGIALRGREWLKLAIDNLGALDIEQYYNLPWLSGYGPTALGTPGANVTSSRVHRVHPERDIYHGALTFTSDSVDTAAEVAVYQADADGDTDVNGTQNYTSVDCLALYLGKERYWWTPVNDTASARTWAGDVIKTTDLGWYDETGGTFIVEFKTGMDVIGDRYVLSIDDGTANNRISLRLNSSGQPVFEVVDGGVTQSTQTGSALSTLTRYRAVFVVTANDVRAYIAGDEVGSQDTSVTLPTSLTEFHVGCSAVDDSQLGGLIYNVQYIDGALGAETGEAMSATGGWDKMLTPLDNMFTPGKIEHQLVCVGMDEPLTPEGYRNALGKYLDQDAREYLKKSTQDVFKEFEETYYVAPPGDAPATPQVADFANVAWQMNMEQATAATLTDQSSNGHTIVYGAGTLDTTTFKYGAQSIHKTDGVSQGWSVNDHASLDIATNDFTMEAFVYFDDVGTNATIAARWHSSTNRAFIWRVSAGDMIFENTTGGSTIASTMTRSWTPTVDTMYHVAICRNSGVMRMFVDGTQLGADEANTDDIYTSTRQMHLMFSNATARNFPGNLDDWRFINGEGIYTEDFTPPTEAHPTS